MTVNASLEKTILAAQKESNSAAKHTPIDDYSDYLTPALALSTSISNSSPAKHYCSIAADQFGSIAQQAKPTLSPRQKCGFAPSC